MKARRGRGRERERNAGKENVRETVDQMQHRQFRIRIMTVWLKRLMVTWYADRVCILNAERERRKEGGGKKIIYLWKLASCKDLQ